MVMGIMAMALMAMVMGIKRRFRAPDRSIATITHRELYKIHYRKL
jgi:hypothetical protein